MYIYTNMCLGSHNTFRVSRLTCVEKAVKTQL